MAATCNLIGLYPTPIDLPAPDPGGSYAIFEVAGFSESGVQAFIRLAPALGEAMAQSQIPLSKIEGVAQLTSAICDYVARGKIDEVEVLVFLQALRQLF